MINEKILKNDERAVFALRSLYKSYGYMPFKMSKFEEYDLYVANKDFLVSDRVITFNDMGGKLLALKPDVTLSIIKNTAYEPGCKSKVFYNENVYRVSGATGQFKEIMQTGLECIGDIDVSDVFEVITLAVKSLSEVSSDFILDVSHMGILSALLGEASDSELFKREITALISEKNAHEAKAVCEKYGIESDSTDKITALATMYGSPDDVLSRLAPMCKSGEAKKAYDQLARLCNLIAGIDDKDRIRIDFSVVNDMNYYNGIVFRGFLSGIAEGVLAGGEYGKLLNNMGRQCDAIGFALYLDLLSELDRGTSEYDVDVLLLYGDDSDAARVSAKKNELIALGRSVTAQKKIPAKLRYRELVEI